MIGEDYLQIEHLLYWVLEDQEQVVRDRMVVLMKQEFAQLEQKGQQVVD